MNSNDPQTTLLSTDSPEPGQVVNHISEVRLRLPDNVQYIDARPDLRQHEIVEQVVFFEDIYPKSNQTITGVSGFVPIEGDDKPFNSYIVTCANTDFIPSVNMAPGATLEAEFLDGDLVGSTFRVMVDEIYLPGGKKAGEICMEFKLVPNFTESEEVKTQMPNESSKPREGNQFVLKGVCKLTKKQVRAAEDELLAQAELWVKEHSVDTDVYTCQTDPVYCAQHAVSLPLGQRVKLVDESRFGPEGRSSRIQEYEKDLLNPYKATYTVGDNSPYSRLGSLETSVQKSQYELMPGVTTGRGTYLIQSQYDVTLPTDYNAYSAAATDARFLSKISGGTVKAPVRFDDDVATGGDVVSSDFRRDAMAGAGYGIYNDENGARVLEIDKVKVRKSLEVNQLVTNQVTHIGGRQIYSAAGMEITRVEQGSEAWRCYMDTRQGQRANRFAAGDQAYCLQYDAGQTDVTKYYWRLVTAVGEDYVELSKTDADGNGIPAPGDNVAQVGNRTNAQRQSMYEIDQTTGGAVTQYAGIDSFSFNGTNCFGQYYDPRDGQAKFYAYGDTYIGDRDPNLPGANYLTLQKGADDDHKKLYISGQVHIGDGSTGLGNLEGWSEAQTKIDAAAEAARSANQIVGAVQDDVEVLRRQIDGQVECWFRDYNPSLTNQPAAAWKDEVSRQMHEGDTFTNLVSGKSWRWTLGGGNWSWEEMDAASARALASASAAQAALDGRCAVFLRTPLQTDRYDVGDLWMNATYGAQYHNELLHAVAAKAAGEPFSIAHWSPATKYTDDTAVEQLRQQVDEEVVRLDGALAQINADDIFTANEKHQIRTLWENINGISGLEHPEEVSSGSYARVLAAAAMTGEPSLRQVFRTARNEEFMVQKE